VSHRVVLVQRGFTGEEAGVVCVTSDLGALLVVDDQRVRDPDVRAESVGGLDQLKGTVEVIDKRRVHRPPRHREVAHQRRAGLGGEQVERG
jgi:hypothetical protein